jgi:2-haloalkanoic acid dehalogenase type II
MGILKGRWPRAIFYDSKGTLFDWPWTWRQAANQIVEKYKAAVTGEQFLLTWAKFFEAFHRRTAAFHYTPVSDLIRESMMTAFKMHDIKGSPEDVHLMLDVQDRVQLFPETEAALTEQQRLGVKILIYSDVERKYLDMYVSKFKKFKPDFVGTTDEAGFHKPHPRTYFWVLRQTGLDVRDVLYCAGPTFDCQGAMAVDMITAQIRRPGGTLAQETFVPGDVPCDYEIDDLHGITEIIRRNHVG